MDEGLGPRDPKRPCGAMGGSHGAQKSKSTWRRVSVVWASKPQVVVRRPNGVKLDTGFPVWASKPGATPQGEEYGIGGHAAGSQSLR